MNNNEPLWTEANAERSESDLDPASVLSDAREIIKMGRYDAEEWLLFSNLIENAPIGFACLNSHLEYVLMNPTMAAMMNGSGPEEFLGKRIGEIQPQLAELIEPVLLDVIATGRSVSDFKITTPTNGSSRERHWLASFYPVFSRPGTEVIGIGCILTDVTDRRRDEEMFRHQFLHDHLTDLPNRLHLKDMLRKAIAEAEGKNEVLAVMFLDLDRLKNVNDALGHAAGDSILQEVSRRLREEVHSSDLVARFGGDDFVILVRDAKDAEHVGRVAKRLLKAFLPAVKIGEYSLHASASIGIALYPYDGTDDDTLLKNADTAVHIAKANGRNRFEFYDRDLNVNANERMELENYLRKAIDKNELRVHYQPIVDAKTGKILSMEALVRWQHPDRGLLYPKEFISLAEESGIIVPMGRWILRKICRDFRTLHRAGKFVVPRVAVNLSAREFLEVNLVREIREILTETEMDPANLEIEVTESIAMDDYFKTSDKLAELSSMGIRITIDDFGTGYSSLAYLKRFPISKLKIDRSFILDCCNNPQDAALVRAIVSMAQSLNLAVVGEGVEEKQQLNMLSDMGCDAVQGNLIGPAQDMRDLSQWFKDRTSLFAQSYWKNEQ